MPTSLSLQDLSLLRRDHSNNLSRSSTSPLPPKRRNKKIIISRRERQRRNPNPKLEEQIGGPTEEEGEAGEGKQPEKGIGDVDEGQHGEMGEMEQDQQDTMAEIPVPEVESEQIIGPSDSAQNIDNSGNESFQRNAHGERQIGKGKRVMTKDKQQNSRDEQQQQDAEQNVDVEEVEVDVDDEAQIAMDNTAKPLDFPLFGTSPMGVLEFSTEFLAISRKHRLQPKARAILLDLLQRTMPESNRCPQTTAEMRKLASTNGRIHRAWIGTTQGSSLPSTSRGVPQMIRPKSHYLLPAASDKQPSTSKYSSSNKRTADHHHYFSQTTIVGTDLLDNDGYMGEEQVEEQIIDDSGMMYYQQQEAAEELSPETHHLLPHIFQTINRLSQEVAMLRGHILANQSSSNSNKTLRNPNKRRSAFSDGRLGLHIYDVDNNKVLLNELDDIELRNTIDISRNDEQRLIYGNNDITDMVLEKVDLAPYLHNPSLCGRIVADVLFSPEYLADKHILAEGQTSSRARLELLPDEMTSLFYDSLRKLGVSRLADEDQDHWLYLARDGVNQRARDLKANRKRKFYINEEQPMVLKEDQI